MLKLRWILAVLFLLPLALAQETVGTQPIRSAQVATLHGPGMNTLTQVGRVDTVMASSWCDSHWVQSSVTTPRAIGENPNEQAARHLPAVLALQEKFPPMQTAFSAPPRDGTATFSVNPDDADTVSVGRYDSVMHSSWKDSSGITHSVDTPRQNGETVTSQAARHSATVNALLLVFPPVATGH